MYRRVAIGLTLGMVVLTFLLDLFSYVSVRWETTWLFWSVATLFFVLRFRYIKQDEPNLVAALETAILAIVYTSLFGIATYLIPEHRSSMWDTELVGADRVLFFGLEARDVILFTRSLHIGGVSVDAILAKIYYSLYLHFGLLPIYATGLRKDPERAFRFLTEMFAAASLGLVFYAMLPAFNAIWFYQLDDTHRTLRIVKHLQILRSGDFTSLHYKSVLGLVQFPSFHMAVQCVLVADVIRNARRWMIVVFLVWTGLMVWATVAVGGHYLIDLVGGALIAVFGVAIGAFISRRSNTDSPVDS